MAYPDKVSPATSTAITSAINSNNSSVVVPGDQARSNAIVTTTWANRATAIAAIAALTPANGVVRVTDAGANGSLWYCDGVGLKISSGIQFGELTTGVLVPSLVAANLATYSQVGTTITVDNTVGHGIPATLFDGNSVYLKVSSGALVEGIYTNFQRTGANTFTCVSAISQTISGNLSTNTSITTIKSFTIPGNILGLNGRFETNVETRLLNTANAKTVTYSFGGTTYYTLSAPSNTLLVNITGMRNKNATNVQNATCLDASTGLSAAISTLRTAAIDTTANQDVALKCTLAAANEYMCIEHCALIVFPG